MPLFIRVDCSFFRHRKTIRLRSLIGDSALWVPPAMWAYAAEHQPDGDLSGFTDKELALAIGYSGDAPSMLQALIQACYLDSDMHIHDWLEHNSYHAAHKERARNAANARWSKERKNQREKDSEEDKIRGEESARARRSAPSIAPSINGASKAPPPIHEIRRRVNNLFKREQDAPWGNDEEHSLSDVSKRPNCLLELDELEEFFLVGSFRPQKARNLLSDWTNVLDQARAFEENRTRNQPSGVPKPKTLSAKLVDEEIARIHQRFGGPT